MEERLSDIYFVPPRRASETEAEWLKRCVKIANIAVPQEDDKLED